MSSLESELKKAGLALAEVDQLKANLVATKQARDSSYTATTQAQNKVATTKATLAQLQAVACGL